MDDIADSFEETVKIQHDNRADRGQGKARGRGGGRRTGRGGGGGANREMVLSKALSRLLRHQAVSAGIQLDREGYAALDKVVSLSALDLSPQRYWACSSERDPHPPPLSLPFFNQALLTDSPKKAPIRPH